MKLLMIRHGDPNYEIDSLTEKGWREAELLAERMEKTEVQEYFVSPLGRAKDTASCTLKRTGRTAVECAWLREFDAPIYRPHRPEIKTITWDWMPGDWTKEEEFFRDDRWFEPPVMEEGKVKEKYEWVIRNLDGLLQEHGYERQGRLYRAVRPNQDTLAFFCHFGLECVLLSHLLNVSPMVLWHGLCAAPTSVTTVVTEERQKGIAYFRMLAFGDTAHLYCKGEPPAFAARFCECFGKE
ncbi:MAG: histidine phosphatase family protein [Lachnospiraceae bacterium]|jgi:broad specificity phosphatase PhoE|nr:histidine phosphatase family protein [Lachnospiraceae bacterium]MCI8995708.1 histidine phosphatase family protein [Lachnospiraceae bacterium]